MSGRLCFVIMLSSVAMAPLLFHLRRNHWRLSIKACIGVTTFIAFACLCVRSDVRELLPYVGKFYPLLVRAVVPMVIWPFLISWIAVSTIWGPIIKRDLPSMAQGIDFKRHAPRRSSTVCFPNWILVVIIYGVFQKAWTSALWLYGWPTSIWFDVNEIGVSLQRIDCAVNWLLVVYVIVSVWGELQVRPKQSSARHITYFIVLVLVLETFCIVGD